MSDEESNESREEYDSALDDVADAERDVADAEATLEAAEKQVEQCRKILDAAQAHLDLVKEWQGRLDAALSNLQDQCTALRQSTSSACDSARSVIAEKLQQLEGYVNESLPSSFGANLNSKDLIPPGWSAKSWIEGKGLPTDMCRPEDIKARFDLNSAQLSEITKSMFQSHPEFLREIERRRADYRTNTGVADRERIFLQTRIRTAGLWGEIFTEKGFSPLAHRLETQRRTTTQDGRQTITDMVLRDLKVDYLIGKGPNGFAPRGSSVSQEIKANLPGSLRAQKDHLVAQVSGHRSEAASIVVVTRDVHDLPVQDSRDLRDAMYQNGSYMLAVLPYKEQIDQLCWDLVQESPDEN